MQVNQCEIEKDGTDCSTCRECLADCPTDVQMDVVMPIYRYLFGKQTAHRNVFETISKLMVGLEPVPWLKDVESDPDSDIAYFPGCTHMVDALFQREKKYSGASQAGVKVLNYMGIKPRIIYGCCGHDLYYAGDLDEFEQVKRKLAPSLEGVRIVVGCPECYHMLKDFYGADVVYFTDFLVEKGVKVPKLDGVTTTYHDACRLGRFEGIYDTPRELISQATELHEMERIRENSQCCGVNSWTNCNVSSMEARKGRVEEGVATGAKYMVSGCSKCLIHFDCFNYDQETKLDTMPKFLDIQELVAWALGIYDPENADPYEVELVRSQLPQLEAVEGKLEDHLTDDVYEQIFSCTSCEACTENCYTSFPVHRKIEELRAELVRMGIGPEKHRKIAETVLRTGNVFGEEPKGVKENPDAEVVYFPGCVATYRMGTVYDATTRMLDAAGIKYSIPEGMVCCGSVLIRTGHDPTPLMETNTRILKGKKVVCSCAGCYSTLKNDYDGLEVYHISEFMAEHMHKLKFKSDNATITYHDPCHLGRACGVYDPPRELIKAVPGITFKEYEHNRENADCCGAGGGVKSAYPEKANALGRNRAQQAEDMNVDVILTSCPFCKLNIGAQTELPMLDILEFLMDHLEE